MNRPPPLTPTLSPEAAAAANRQQLAARTPTDTVVELSVASGSNTVAHGQGKTPRGHNIIYATCTITDASLDATNWVFTASAAGTVKLIWM